MSELKELTVALNEQRLPVFVAVVLDEASHRKLLSWWEATTGEPVLTKKVYAHHMTIKFKPTAADMAKHKVGQKVDLVVTGWASNGKVQAVAVEGYESTNAHPHITIATDGSPPKLSDALLGAGYTRVKGPVLHGEIQGGR